MTFVKKLATMRTVVWFLYGHRYAEDAPEIIDKYFDRRLSKCQGCGE